MTDAKARRVGILAAWVGSVIVALGIGWWAALQATEPPQVSAPGSESISVEVTEGTISVEQSYGIDVSWAAAPIGVNGFAGTLTSLAIDDGGSAVNSGDTLYTVDLSPVVAMEGTVPAFRDLGVGSEGPDVRQLQAFLTESGYLSGEPDGEFGRATASAVNAWLKSLGLPQTATVPLGRVVFIATLPASVAPAADLRVGTLVTPGQETLLGAESEPEFSFRVLPEAVSRTEEGLGVRIDADGEEWLAEVDRLATSTDDYDGTIAILRPAGEATSICGADCALAVPLGGTAVLPGVLVLVPPVSGSQVPTAAILTDASGSRYVVTDAGERIDIELLASNDGMSIVTGVEPGDRVLLPEPSESSEEG